MAASQWRLCYDQYHVSHHPSPRLDAKKKIIAASEQDPVARAQWRSDMEGVDPNKLVFVDEASTNIGFTRLYGRAPRGERAYGSAPPSSKSRAPPTIAGWSRYGESPPRRTAG